MKQQTRPAVGITLCLLALSTAMAQPSDPFTGASPSAEGVREEPQSQNVGDWGVSQQRGAATYTFPIDLPNGRNGMAPSLVLRYSSQSRLRGGVAAGWTLDLPAVRLDRGLGTEAREYFAASLGSVSGRLVEVPDKSPYPGKAYRVDFDTSFTRFFRSTERWVALSSDGVKHFFEQQQGASDGSTRWNITRQVDFFGNTVHYFWSDVSSLAGTETIDHGIDRIEYSSNDAAGLSAHAKVEFEYAPLEVCSNSKIPIGAAPVLLPPGKVEGARRLIAIRISVRDEPGGAWRLSKGLALEYRLRSSVLHDPVIATDPTEGELPCTQSLLRYLTKISVKAFDPAGSSTSLPPVTFQYNNRIDTTAPTLPTQPDPLAEHTVDTQGQSHFGTLDGATGTSLDIDSDGVRDKVSVAEEGRVCMLIWQRGLLGGTFEPQVRRSRLPTVPWYQEWKGTPEPALLPKERCTLNGQVAYRERDTTSGTKLAKGVLSYHFMDYTGDGRLDLLTNVWATAHHPTYIPGIEIEPAVLDEAAAPLLPDDPGPGNADFAPMSPEGGGNRHIWRVYRNAGDPDAVLFPADPNARFATIPMKVVSPRPLPPSASDERLDTKVLESVDYSIPPLADIDGDGFLDVIDVTRDHNLLGRGNWTVYLGNGGPSFPALIDAINWEVPRFQFAVQGNGYDDEQSECGVQFVRVRRTVAGLHDIDANGLPDLVVQTDDGRLKAYRNTGAGFETTSTDWAFPQPLERSQTDCTVPDPTQLKDGNRGYRQRLTDLDGDDRIDLITFSGFENDITAEHSVTARFNMGDRFGPPVQLPSVWLNTKRLLAAKAGSWGLVTEFAEVNGDGMPDLVRWNSDNTATYIKSPGLPQAPDLLRAVENGRGKRVEFRYAATTNPAVVEWSTLIHNGGPHLSSVLWVVEQTTVDGGFSTPPMVTTYRYRNPHYLNPSRETGIPERSHFAGFEETTKTVEREKLPVNRVKTEFSYGSDGSPEGVPIREWVYQEDGGISRLHTFEETTWRRRPLFSGQVSFVHRLKTLKRTCEPNSTEAACMVQKVNVLRSHETWRVVASGVVVPDPTSEPAELYVHAATHRGTGFDQQEGDRRTSYQYQVRYGQNGFAPDDYRVLTRMTRLLEAVADGPNLQYPVRERTRHVFNAAGLPQQTDVFHDDSTFATTKRTFDVQTGNQLSETRPMQSAAGGSGKNRTFEFDGHRLFVLNTTNELGHKLTARYDVATGTLLERRGPNFKNLGSGDPVFERENWSIDGFGRVVEHSISLDDDTAGYVSHVVDKTMFFDLERPNRIRRQRLRDFGGDLWVTEDRKIDGLGRLLSNSMLVGPGQVATTTYMYDSTGNLSSTEVPDPATDGLFARYEYHYDGLSRLKNFIRPDGSGLSVDYEGLTKTSREIAPDGSGSTKKQVYDIFSRVTEVQELDGSSVPSVTHYRYDASDNLAHVRDADGNTTDLAHNWIGKRTAITRGTRSWTYKYDLNGRLMEEVTPLPESTRYGYDDLDRLTEIKFQDGNQAKTIRHFYDDGPNSTGRLRRVELPFGTVKYSYDARGLTISEQRAFAVSHTSKAGDNQTVTREYNALGFLTHSAWEDGQQWRINYDQRGLVGTVEWRNPQLGSWQQVASYLRSIAGQPRKRDSSFGQSQDFSYDVLGRPVTDTITSSGVPVSIRSYEYSDSGDLVAVTGATNGNPVTASYTYDPLHRLRTADGPNGYVGAFSYSPAGNVLTAEVTWNGSQQARNVRYEYGARDPQAVDRMVNQSGNGAYATFAYDLAGNVVKRNTPQGDWSLEWDGLGRIRRVQSPNGAEVYYYDHTGARMVAVSEQDGVRFWFAEKETHYGPDGTRTRHYLHLSGGGPTLARVKDGSEIELQYSDALQNLLVSLDSKGQVVASFLYGPFGEVVQSAGAEDHRRQFNGKENDAITDLRYYGFRYYDPLSLRWNSADPMYRFVPEFGQSEPQRMNLYSFSLNNPVRYYDPDGRDANDADDQRENPDELTCDLPEPGSCQVDAEGNTDSETSSPDNTQESPSQQVSDRSKAFDILQDIAQELAENVPRVGPLIDSVGNQVDIVSGAEEIAEGTDEGRAEKVVLGTAAVAAGVTGKYGLVQESLAATLKEGTASRLAATGVAQGLLRVSAAITIGVLTYKAEKLFWTKSLETFNETTVRYLCSTAMPCGLLH